MTLRHPGATLSIFAWHVVNSFVHEGLDTGPKDAPTILWRVT